MIKVSRFLKTLPKDQVIKVGTKEGNGWWYVGTVKDFSDHLDVYDQMLMDTAEKYLKIGTNAYNSKISKGTPEYYIRAFSDTDHWKDIMNVDHYTKWLDSWFKSIIRKKSALIKLESYCKNYRHLASREVVDWSKADEAIEENCIRIIISGIERGVYWATSDAKQLPSVGLDVNIDKEEKEGENDAD